MTDYQELKRLAEAATAGPWVAVARTNAYFDIEAQNALGYVAKSVASTSIYKAQEHAAYIAAASPDVVLGIIKSLEHSQMAANSEAKEVDERNAVIDRLRTQNQALREALKDTAQTLAWMQHGKCRGFSDGLLTTDQALDKARAALAQAEGGV